MWDEFPAAEAPLLRLTSPLLDPIILAPVTGGIDVLAQGGRFLFGLITGLLVGGILYLLVTQPRGAPIQLLPPSTPSPLRVHIAGAVRSPGVYSLDASAIVSDAIELAGGALPGADLDALNLAAPLEDGERVSVPYPGTQASSGDAPSAVDGVVDLNTATAADLETLPGIGPTLAGAIIAYREQNGPFLSVEDLLEVPGIGPTRMSQLRELVKVD